MIASTFRVIVLSFLVVLIALLVGEARGFVPWLVEQTEPISAK